MRSRARGKREGQAWGRPPHPVIPSPRPPLAARRGFTLLEVLVAVVILAMVFVVIWRTFEAAVGGLNRGQKFMENLHHGDYVVEQLVGALRSAAYYESRKDKYGFWLNQRNGHDAISWVTASSAFMGPRSPYRDGLHRVEVLIDDDREGRPCFTVRAWPQLADDKDEIEPQVWNISSKIIGLSCEVYNPESEDWETRWEDTNAVPRLVKLELDLAPVEKDEPAIEIHRIIEIPVGPPLDKAVSTTSGGSAGGASSAGAAAAGGAR